MALYTLGQLPGSQLHLAVNLATPRIELALGQARNQVLALQAQLDAFAELDLELPTLNVSLDFFAGIAADFLTLRASASAGIKAQLSALADLTAAISGLIALLSVGLGGTGVAGYTYSGDAPGLSEKLRAELSSGLAGGEPDDEIDALILASSSAEEWARLQVMLYAPPAGAPAGGTPQGRSLRSLGTIPGATLHAGALLVLPQLEAELVRIAAQVTALGTASVQLQLQAPFLDPLSTLAVIGGQVAALATAAVTAPLVGVSYKVSLEFDLFLALGLIAVLEPIQASLELGLGGPGVVAYRYHGQAQNLAQELSQATSGGIAGGAPGDNVNALVLATGDPDEWGRIETMLSIS